MLLGSLVAGTAAGDREEYTDIGTVHVVAARMYICSHELHSPVAHEVLNGGALEDVGGPAGRLRGHQGMWEGGEFEREGRWG